MPDPVPLLSVAFFTGLRQIIDRQDAEVEASYTASAGEDESVYQTRCQSVVMVDTLPAVEAMVRRSRNVQVRIRYLHVLAAQS